MLASKGIKIPTDFDMDKLTQQNHETREEPRSHNYNTNNNDEEQRNNDNEPLGALTQQIQVLQQ